MNGFTGLWVVIPAYNEGEVIARVVAEVHAVHPQVIVVDDCSRDDTSTAALRGGATVLRHAVNLGQGAALVTGIRCALERGAEFIVTFDADGQHRVQDISVLQDRQRETGADIVVGSRFMGVALGMPALRRFVLKMAARYTRLTSGVALTDAHNGLRLLTRHAAEQLRLRQNRMAHASEIIDQVGVLGLKIAEAPVVIQYTEYSLRKGQRLSNAVNILWEILLARLNK